MARAETIESVGETGIGTHGLFSQHNTCCMELTRPLQSWPGLLSTATITISPGNASTPVHRHHNDHSLQPLQAISGSYHSSYLHPEGQAQPQPHHQLPTLSSATHPLPLQNQGGEFDEGFPGQQSGLDQRTQQERSHRRGPLPDLLPQTEHLSRLSSPPRGPDDGTLQLRVRRVAIQLRTIGDEFNATLLHRADAPYWQDWRDACRVLLNFITQTLSTLYRLT
ncbi:bcl-2-binding component 3 [Takifugu rubripes]|uniref:bcl-2-binding component 3 n=1 Tax=Takifugu rubripes TaxID=31033 RepID=UPI0005D2ADC0|nr:uncharacterized protein LOC105417107 [Takifugu rubripes]|eukprot:XP_011607015.1 PREDICTED: uncharacterized protein LOC105417107 [Takifugu rubripes]